MRASGNRPGAMLAEGAHPHGFRCPRAMGMSRPLTHRTGAGVRNGVARTSPSRERDDQTGAASPSDPRNGAAEKHTLYPARAEISSQDLPG